MKDVVYPVHHAANRLEIPHVANVKFDLLRRLRHFRLKFVAHIVLLLLVTGEDADLPNVRAKKAVQHGIAEGTGPAGDEEGFIGEHFSILLHIVLFSFVLFFETIFLVTSKSLSFQFYFQ